MVVLSNAEPYVHRYEEDEVKCEELAGGLTAALDPLLRDTGGTWVAWGRGEADMDVVGPDGAVTVPGDGGYRLKRLGLSNREAECYYRGFSNRVLWPISHSFPERAVLAGDQEEWWRTFVRVNKRFADAAVEEMGSDDILWVHDYQLSLVPGLVKEERPDAEVAFFWHIPWPPWEAFRVVPRREEILEGIIGADLAGFHIERYVENFLDCAEKIGLDPGDTKVSSVPVGVDADWFEAMGRRSRVNEQAEELREELGVEKLLLGIDRLDYTKGIPERLRAFEFFLERNPDFKGRATMLQHVSPSRTEIDDYRGVLDRIYRVTGEINSELGTPGWTPVKVFCRHLPAQRDLVPYHVAADVALITPLVDGMNLTCKEYVASTDDGVLVLSEFAGAAEQLEGSLKVNPYDVKCTAETIENALSMERGERARRLDSLKDGVRDEDVEWWVDEFMEDLSPR